MNYRIFCLLILFINCNLILAQHQFASIPVSKNVESIEQISVKKSWFKPRQKIYYTYENGKVSSIQIYKGKELTNTTNYTYKFDNHTETIIESRSGRENNTIIINQYDDHSRLIRSETFRAKYPMHPYLIQSNFKYNEDNSIKFYNTTSTPFDHKSKNYSLDKKSVSEVQIETIDKFTKLHRSLPPQPGAYFEVSLSYDSINHSINSSVSKCLIVGIAHPKNFRKLKHSTVESDSIKIDGKMYEVKKYSWFTKYLLDEYGNWIETYTISKRGREKLSAKRIIVYKEE